MRSVLFFRWCYENRSSPYFLLYFYEMVEEFFYRIMKATTNRLTGTQHPEQCVLITLTTNIFLQAIVMNWNSVLTMIEYFLCSPCRYQFGISKQALCSEVDERKGYLKSILIIVDSHPWVSSLLLPPGQGGRGQLLSRGQYDNWKGHKQHARHRLCVYQSPEN